MSFWDGVASFGLGAQGYNDYTDSRGDRAYVEAKRKRDEEISNIELEKLRRQDDLGRSTRDIAKEFGIGGPQQLPATAATTSEIPQPVTSDEGENNTTLPPATKTTPGLSAQSNQAGMYGALADAHDRAGNFDQAQKIRQSLKALESEGYGTVLKGVASGADPDAIKRDFNTVGAHRIVSADKNGDAYTFVHDDGTTRTITPQQASDLGEKLGILKREKPTVVPEGGTLVDDRGTVVATGQPKQKNIDPLSEAGIAASAKLAEAKAKAKMMFGADVVPAKVKEVKFLAERAFGGDEAAAIDFVYGNRDKSRTDQILHAATMLKADPELSMDHKALMKAAENVVDGLRAKDKSTRGGKSPTGVASPVAATDQPEQLSGPGTPGASAPALETKPPAGYPEAQKAPDGKWYVKRGDAYFLVKD